MKRYLTLFAISVLAMFVVTATVQAQEPLSSEISYQGVLRESGDLVTGDRDMIFGLYSDSTCATQVGSDIALNGVSVSNGVFNVAIPVEAAAFNGQALHIQATVGGTAVGCTSILPTPYALNLRPGAEIDSDAATSIFRAINRNTAERTRALYGKTTSSITDTAAVYGHAEVATGEVFGVYGKTDSATNGTAGVYGVTTATAGRVFALYGYTTSPDGRALQAVNGATTGQARGVYASTASTEGQALYAHANAITGTTIGVYGKTDSATDGASGVYGQATATAGRVYALYGYTTSPDGRALQAVNEATTGQARGVYASTASTEGQALYAHANAASGDTIGAYGKADSPDGTGVYGYATAVTGTNYGVWGKTDSPNGYAGYFEGNVEVKGDVVITGTLSAQGGKNFRIDHPLAPTEMYLVHASIESPERLNIYNGNVVLNARGEAIVELPAYFEALNTDYRYQLTAIGGPGAGLYIAEEISDNQFKIAGGTAGLKVSWEVTGVRNDTWAQENPFAAEVRK